MSSFQSPWVLGPLAFILWLVAFLVVKRFLLRAIRRVAAKTASRWKEVLVQALSAPLLLAIVVSGLQVLERILPLSPEWDRALDVALAAALALALVLFVDRACRGILDLISEKAPMLQGAQGLVQGLVRGIIIALGVLIFLDSIGVSITPILASLGIGSLAVALALKETLANLFAGLYMIVDKPIEPGHFIGLEGGQEGIVTRVSWRSTWIRMPGNSMVVVPNSKMVESVITNYSLPGPEVDARVEVGVHYDSDLDQVERAALEVAQEAMRTVEGGVPGGEARIRFHTLADSSINFSVILRAASHEAIPDLRHEVIRRLLSRFREEGIVIPYPIRTLDLPPDRPEELPMRTAPADAGPGRTPADTN